MAAKGSDIIDLAAKIACPVPQGFSLPTGQVKFSGQVLKTVKRVSYHISLKRVILRRLVMAIADGIMKADGKIIYKVKDMKVGLFTSNN